VTLPRPCVDCGDLVPSGSRCAPCKAAQPEGPRRPRPSRPRAWRRLSKRARTLQPWCENCGTTDDLSADHLTPTSCGGQMVPDLTGVRVLCRPCNARAYAEQRAQHDPGAPPPTPGEVPHREGRPGAELTQPIILPGDAP
jgi:5-methylcytosine-specific restriction endonuclease McrA